MNKTLLGKLLICVNLALSVALAAVAVGIYTQRIPWATPPGTPAPGQLKSELVQRQERIKAVGTSLLVAETNQQVALAELRQVEQLRPAFQKWYAAQLEQMGNLPEGKGPVQVLALQAGGVVADNKNFGRPSVRGGTDRANRPLQSLAVYHKKIKEAYEQIIPMREKLIQLADEDKTLTEQRVNGPRGLLQRNADEEDKIRRVEAEIRDFVKPRLLNLQLESVRVHNQQQQLRERIEELKRSVDTSAGR